jgi:AcrR family transcriptional regulator
MSEAAGSAGAEAGMSEALPAPGPRSAARERILDAAYELFSQQGVRGVGVDTVIDRAGVAKMTL